MSTGGAATDAGLGGSWPVDPCAAGDVFDPAQVYLLGAVDDDCSVRAIVNLSCPEQAAAGLDCSSYGRVYPLDWEDAFVIRPNDGRLVYWKRSGPGTGDLFEFRCDDCPYAGSNLSENVFANDVLVPNACDRSCGLSVDFGPDFLVAPTGETFFLCGCTEDWRSTNGENYGRNSIGHLGYDQLSLNFESIIDHAQYRTTGIDIPTDIPELSFIAARAKAPRSFLVAVAEWPDYEAVALWELNTEGDGTLVGTYPLAPDGVYLQGQARLDGNGALFQHGDRGQTHVVVRRTIEGTSTVVYSEDAPTVIREVGWVFATGP